MKEFLGQAVNIEMQGVKVAHATLAVCPSKVPWDNGEASVQRMGGQYVLEDWLS